MVLLLLLPLVTLLVVILDAMHYFCTTLFKTSYDNVKVLNSTELYILNGWNAKFYVMYILQFIYKFTDGLFILETMPGTMDTNITKTWGLSSRGSQSSERRQIYKIIKYSHVIRCWDRSWYRTQWGHTLGKERSILLEDSQRWPLGQVIN